MAKHNPHLWAGLCCPIAIHEIIPVWQLHTCIRMLFRTQPPLCNKVNKTQIRCTFTLKCSNVYQNFFIQTKLKQKHPIHTFQIDVLKLIDLRDYLPDYCHPLYWYLVHYKTEHCTKDTSISFCITINAEFKPEQLSHLCKHSSPHHTLLF